jgi:phage N-6-adenine-methyltransferase
VNNTTPSGSVAPGPSGASPDLDSEIAGGPDSTGLVAINSVARRVKPPVRDDGDEYTTLPEVVAELAAEFGPFDLDPAANASNAKAPRFYDVDVDGLSQPWTGRVFLNPPYGGPGRAKVLESWIHKAADETRIRRALVVVALLPAWTDTDWWHDVVWPAVKAGTAEVRFHRRRLEFLNPAGKRCRPVRATCTVIFRSSSYRRRLDWLWKSHPCERGTAKRCATCWWCLAWGDAVRDYWAHRD